MFRLIITDNNRRTDTERTIRGWKVMLRRDPAGGYEGFVSAERRSVKFTLTQDSADFVTLQKYVSGVCVDTKRYRTDGVRCCDGCLNIHEHSNPDRTYAFWRNGELQSLLDSAGILRLRFAKSNADTFDYELPKPADGHTFYTDGTVQYDAESGFCLIHDASYLLKTDINELILVHNYDIDVMTDKILTAVSAQQGLNGSELPAS